MSGNLTPADNLQRSQPRTWTAALWLRALLAVWAVLAGEAIVTLWLARREVSSSWELTHGLAHLALLLVLPATAVGFSTGLLWGALLESGRRKGARVLLLAAVGIGAALAGYSVGGGRHLSAPSVRFLFAASIGLVSCGFAWWASPRFARWSIQRSAWVSWVGVAIVVLLEIINARVLVRLYPGFHFSLAILTLLFSPMCLEGPRQEAPASGARAGTNGHRTQLVLLGFALAGLLTSPLIVSSARNLARFDNLRLILSDRAPLLGQVIRIAAKFAPPAPLADCGTESWGAACGAALPKAAEEKAQFSLQGRDILLITVDALRADHLGVYGYSRATSPNIDELARGAVKFNYAYAPTAHTSYSVTSLMTGKYMRPLLMQGAGADSDTLATLLRRYAYRTAAFYPPAVFFIDPQRFESFRDSFLGFEYRKVEFLEGPPRATQVAAYVESQPAEQRLFVWVHLFGPHEPYEARPGFDFGPRDVDRYDSEIAYADAAIGQITRAFRAKRPTSLVVVSADHGEEFGDHGGRYHGATVYEEQVRVPLIVNAPGLFEPHTVDLPVQTIDLFPTILAGLDVPPQPRVRGRSLARMLLGQPVNGGGLALAESEEQIMLAEENYRLICQRQLGACRLFDIKTDPGEQTDLRVSQAERFERMRRAERELSASHGRYESQGLRAEGKGWPSAILRGIAGDADAGEELATLLDDADAAIRRKAAEVLFELNYPAASSALRLALTRDEDPTVRAWCALALTRAGQGAPLVYDLLSGQDAKFARLAALALADSGDARGVDQLVAWWRDASARNYQQSRWLLSAFAKLKAKPAVPALVQSLGDVRLRPDVAGVLAEIGDSSAREPLARAFADERYQNARAAIARALVQLHAKEEMVRPLQRFLGVPDPIVGGLGIALDAKILQFIGGPEPKQLKHLVQRAAIGTRVTLQVPRSVTASNLGLRLIARLSNEGSGPAELRVLPGKNADIGSHTDLQKLALMNFNSSETKPLVITVPEKVEPAEYHCLIPDSFHWSEGHSISVDVLATTNLRVLALAVVPLAQELPPPAPKPWRPGAEPSPSPVDGTPSPGSGGP